ncbi:MAG: hypothetical protein IPM15_19240 [Betaproteobacteria bacterium]|nr:hypothetical protein [Betaproteobacteria bacterium]MCC6247275.1 hypothetical protein [Rubrivivax sp.]
MKYPTAIDESIARRFVKHRSKDLGYKVALVLAPLDRKVAAGLTALPVQWRTALEKTTWPEAATALGWDRLREHLPRVCELLDERVVGLGALLPTDEPPTLLYFLTGERSELVAFEGFLPSKTPAKTTPPDLAAVQKVHDGWFEFYSGELGPMPEEEWEPLGEGDDDLVSVAIKGSASVGFIRNTQAAHIVWSEDDEVEPVASVTAALDDWIASSFDED